MADANEAGVAVFHGHHGAEVAFSNARDRDPRAPWLNDAAFVEIHPRGRFVFRGTVLGHYIDIDDEADLIGRDTAVGAIAGGAVGLLGGPPGLAAGLVVGGNVGGVIEASHFPKLGGPEIDELRRRVPDGASAVVVVADADRVTGMYDALQEDADTFARYHLAPDAEAELRARVAQTPVAAPPPPGA
jgi:uncharacterized membrane protein